MIRGPGLGDLTHGQHPEQGRSTSIFESAKFSHKARHTSRKYLVLSNKNARHKVEALPSR